MSNIFDTKPPAEEPAPLVDEALAATDRSADGHADLQALKAEIAQLREAVRSTARGAGRMALHEVRGRVEEQPIMAAVSVGLLAFLYGITR